jgi:hypothetical protein
MSQLEVDKVIPQSGTTLTLGESGDTVSVPSGATIDTSGATVTLPTTIEVDTIEPQSGTTLTLGASGDTITIPSGATLTNSGTATGFGIVLQVVQTVFTGRKVTTSSSFADVSGASVTITPTSASNKILIFVNANDIQKTDSSSGAAGAISLLRSSTSIAELTSQATFTNTAIYNNIGSVSGTFLDSPATTSATTYKLQFKTASGEFAINEAGGADSMITAMEILA